METGSQGVYLSSIVLDNLQDVTCRLRAKQYQPRKVRYLYSVFKKMRKVFYLILTGLALGILLAPDRGSDTWQKITDCLDDLKSKTKDTINDLAGGAKKMAEKGKKGAEKAANEW